MNVPAYTPSAGRHTLRAPRRSRSGTRARGRAASPCSTRPRTSCGRPRIAAAASTSPRASSCGRASTSTARPRRARPPIGRRDQTETEHLEAELGAHALQQRDVAVAPVPEVEVGADDHEARAEHAREHLAHEVFRGLLAARLVEREHEALVDRAGRFEQLELLVERRQQLGRRPGPDDLGGMPVEREHGRAQPARRARSCTSRSTAWCPRCTPSNAPIVTARARRRVRDDSSDRARRSRAAPASTTAGFTPAPRRS